MSTDTPVTTPPPSTSPTTAATPSLSITTGVITLIVGATPKPKRQLVPLDCDCPPCTMAASSAPIRYTNGEIAYSVTDLVVPGNGGGFPLRRTYANQFDQALPGVDAPYWVPNLPYMVESTDSNEMSLILDANNAIYFEKQGSDYVAKFGQRQRLNTHKNLGELIEHAKAGIDSGECLKTLEISGHGNPRQINLGDKESSNSDSSDYATIISQSNIRYVASRLSELDWCCDCVILLSGCNTGLLRVGWPQELADLTCCTVKGTRGYLRGTVFDKNVKVTRDASPKEPTPWRDREDLYEPEDNDEYREYRPARKCSPCAKRLQTDPIFNDLWEMYQRQKLEQERNPIKWETTRFSVSIDANASLGTPGGYSRTMDPC